MEDKIYIEQKSYQNLIWEFIASGEYKKILASMRNGDNPEFHDGFILGLCWASLMTCKAETKIEIHDKKVIENIIKDGIKQIEEGKSNLEPEESHILEDLLSQPYKGEPLKVTL